MVPRNSKIGLVQQCRPAGGGKVFRTHHGAKSLYFPYFFSGHIRSWLLQYVWPVMHVLIRSLKMFNFFHIRLPGMRSRGMSCFLSVRVTFREEKVLGSIRHLGWDSSSG